MDAVLQFFNMIVGLIPADLMATIQGVIEKIIAAVSGAA